MEQLKQITSLGLLLFSFAMAQQVYPAAVPSSLVITSPPNGSVFEPGQTVVLTVEAKGAIPGAVAVISPLGTDFKTDPPFTLFLAISPNEPLGVKRVTVVTRGRSDNDPIQAAIDVHIETSTPVTNIRVEPAKISFSSSWQEQVSVKGIFTDGQVRTITKSSETRYVSANPQIAKVSPEGLVEPAADNGSTTITVTYKDKSVSVPVKVELKRLSVPMDIKPEDPRNAVNLRSKGRLPVAIFSTKDFDASMIIPQTIRFGPNGARSVLVKEGDRDDRDEEDDRDERGEQRRPVSILDQHLEDINGDRLPDLLLFFRIPDIGLTCADTQATLTGFTLLGEKISGSDAVQPVGPGCR